MASVPWVPASAESVPRGGAPAARAARRPGAARLLVLLVLILAACAAPATRADREATTLALQREDVPGAGFVHAVYRPAGASPAASPEVPLRVYLGGDASPRRARRWLPPDPTPWPPVMLRLFARDPAPGLYLGRPCQHAAGRCHPRDWTTGRYAPAVLASLESALRATGALDREAGVVLLGYSGGGALAMLLAERLPGVRAVVTLAGNLDVAAWTAHHRFTPLAASLDPARRPPLPPDVVQLHVLGGRDRNVPPALVLPVLARQPHARVRLVAEADHACCWQEVWPAVLAELDALLAAEAQKNAARKPNVKR